MRVVLASLLLLLSACATVPSSAPSYTLAAAPPEGYSNVYIYRHRAYPTLRAPMVQVNGIEVISMAEGAYTVVQLPPGEHHISVNWAWDTGRPDVDASFDVKADQPAYIKVSGSFEPQGLNYIAGSLIGARTQAEAEPEMRACCRYVAPRAGAERPVAAPAAVTP